jgi:uncharacterized membrane protein YphA (DoxX/SURF4 family)
MDSIRIVLQAVLALAFAGSGILKLVPGDTAPKRNYAQLRLPGWWLAPIGAVEVVAALCLLVGFWQPESARAGAALAGCAMLGAVGAHLLRDPRFGGYPALVLLVGSVALLALRAWA